MQQPVLVSLRGDQELNEVKLVNAVGRRTEQRRSRLQRAINPDDLQRQGSTAFPSVHWSGSCR
ncbi:MAG: hypothetical protein CM15mP77_3260 [Synechococcus sp.]|nr:MAG: hypothetical protein CM15mP77_3260 [Synechococcus sp.]